MSFILAGYRRIWGSPGGPVVKNLQPMQESFCQCRRLKRLGFNSWLRWIPWRREWQPTQVLLPGKFHGWRSKVGYSPWGWKESDTTEQLHSLTHSERQRYQRSNCQYSLDREVSKEVPEKCLLLLYWLFQSLWLFEWVSEVTQSCPTICNSIYCSLQGSPFHGIFQSRVLEWVAILILL